MRKAILASLLFFTTLIGIDSQTNSGILKGRIFNAKTNEGVPFATIQIWGTSTGTVSDYDGFFTITDIKPGYIELRVSSIGFRTYISSALFVTNSNPVSLDIPLEENVVSVGEVIIKASPFAKKIETPLSARIIGLDEIEKNPGGNRDISRVIQSFPGVASTPAYRNDVIVRGGGPNENRFYIDNVEIPYLNHFSTQGASGGPVGIINVDFVQSVDFISGAFPASRGNALSSILNFTLIDGNNEKLKYRATLGASDLGLTIDGPAGENSSVLLSARRSYLKFLFNALGLPFLPNYTDLQFKYRSRIDDKNEITLIGLGAKDDFVLNTNASETEFQRYILDYIPIQEQYSYTTGIVYKHFTKEGYDTWVLSRNYLNNTQFKYSGNVEADSNKLFDYFSGEGEIKARFEKILIYDNGLRVSLGTGYDYSHYRNSTYRRIYSVTGEEEINYDTNLKFSKFNISGQISKPFLKNKLRLSFGVRTDFNTWDESMSNPFSQISPRLSASYSLTENLNVNFNAGRYYQLPPYTSLGYTGNSGVFINKENNLKYINSDHIVAGFEFIPSENAQITVESFYKRYSKYPFSVRDRIPLSSKSADYGIFGDEELISSASGRAYGIEFLSRLKEFRNINLIFSYTFVRSEFRADNSSWIPSSWDNRHLLNIIATKNIGKNWDFGFKWRFVGGAPYTPYDLEKSSLKEAWDIQGQGYPDYTVFNSKRLKAFHQLDIRIDKQYFLKGWSLMLYADVQNIYNHKADQPDILIRQSDQNGYPLTDPSDPIKYALKFIENETGTVLPTIGIMVEF